MFNCAIDQYHARKLAKIHLYIHFILCQSKTGRQGNKCAKTSFYRQS